MEKTFGSIVQSHRKEKKWTVKAFIEQLGNDISPAYITKIEVYGEIPSPTLICRIAKVFNLEYQYLLGIAKNEKIKIYSDLLEKKYTQIKVTNRENNGK